MITLKTLRQLATYSVSLHTFVAPSGVAKDTVYMPSQVAARVLGGAQRTTGEVKAAARDADERTAA